MMSFLGIHLHSRKITDQLMSLSNGMESLTAIIGLEAGDRAIVLIKKTG